MFHYLGAEQMEISIKEKKKKEEERLVRSDSSRKFICQKPIKTLSSNEEKSEMNVDQRLRSEKDARDERCQVPQPCAAPLCVSW